jgi:ribonuclease P/MRP protein subunit RPP40
MIKRTITCKNIANIMNFYKTLVRPILDYCSAIWNPYQKQDITKLEKVQRRATKMITGLRNLPYRERYRRCKLMTLEERRRRYDLLEMFKIMKGMYKIDEKQLFERNKNNTRGHHLKIKKNHCRLNVRKNFFTQRVINDWNKLPEKAVNTETINNFKNEIDPMFYEGAYMIQ